MAAPNTVLSIMCSVTYLELTCFLAHSTWAAAAMHKAVIAGRL